MYLSDFWLKTVKSVFSQLVNIVSMNWPNGMIQNGFSFMFFFLYFQQGKPRGPWAGEDQNADSSSPSKRAGRTNQKAPQESRDLSPEQGLMCSLLPHISAPHTIHLSTLHPSVPFSSQKFFKMEHLSSVEFIKLLNGSYLGEFFAIILEEPSQIKL